MAYVVWRVFMKKYARIRLGVGANRNTPPGQINPVERPARALEYKPETKADASESTSTRHDAVDDEPQEMSASQSIRKSSKVKRVKTYLKKCKDAALGTNHANSVEESQNVQEEQERTATVKRSHTLSRETLPNTCWYVVENFETTHVDNQIEVVELVPPIDVSSSGEKQENCDLEGDSVTFETCKVRKGGDDLAASDRELATAEVAASSEQCDDDDDDVDCHIDGGDSKDVSAIKEMKCDVASLVDVYLSPIYLNYDKTRTVLIRQARDVLVCTYHGNLTAFERDFLAPAAELLRSIVDATGKDKTYTARELSQTELRRALSLFDLIALGAFATLGVGLYVMAGDLARNRSGPAAILAFAFASVASILSGLCYAEFSCRVPRTGSAYVYTYITIGEILAFIIGWNMLLEYAIGASSVARGLVNYVDAIPGVDNVMENYLKEKMPMNVYFLAPYPDFLAGFIILIVTAWIAWGVKESAIVNNVFSILNMATIITVIIGGAYYSKVEYWYIPKEDIPKNITDIPPSEGKNGGEGGFLPFGIMGVSEGAAIAFYAFVGFDAIATTGEEAKNPGRNIPLAICISLTIISAAYFGVSTVLTMMLPYYEQNVKAPLPYAFQRVGSPGLMWVVTIGALFALLTSIFGSTFPLPRVLYAMADDGLVFKFLARVHPWTKTPVIATFTAGSLAAIMAAMFDLDQLINMMSIGTLFSYTIVALSVMILRYEHPDRDTPDYAGNEEKTREGRLRNLDIIFNISRRKYPSLTSSKVTKCTIGIFYIIQFILLIVIVAGIAYEFIDNVICLSTIGILLFAILITLIILSVQPTATHMLSFKVPLVPVLTCLSVMINTYLIVMLEPTTWIRFAIWMSIGFLIYFFYGRKHSVAALRAKEAQQAQQEQPQT